MEKFYIYLIEFSLGSFILYAYYQFAWKNNNAYNLRRGILLSILILSIILPLISIETENINAIAANFNLDAFTFNATNNSVSNSALNWPTILLYCYFLGLIFSLIHSLKGLRQILKIRLNSESENKGDHTLVKINGSFPTFSFLNTLYWNDKTPLDDKDKQMIYSHELTHIHQLHSLDLIFISFCRILFWFNPVIHLLYKEISLVHECIADKEVVKIYSPGNYLNLLANQTIYNMQYQWINQFASVSSLKRMRAIKNAKRSPVALRLLTMLPLIAILFTAISCENSVESADAKMESQKTEKVTQAEDMPTFVGGTEAMLTYLTSNLKYPESAKKEGVGGKVIVSFNVEKDGSIRNAEVVKSVNPELDEEALRVVESMPKWKPGSKDGDNVKVKMTLPIVFAL